MNKALLYLLLFIGISLGVFFAGGLIAGMIIAHSSGTHDVLKNEASTWVFFGTAGLILVTIWGVIQQFVFIHFGYANYSLGHLSKDKLCKVTLFAFLAFLGIRIIENLVVPINIDSEMTEYLQWVHTHPFKSILFVVIVSTTLDLVIFGGIFRELNNHFHHSRILIPILAGILGLLSGIGSGGIGIVLFFIFYLIGFWIYECTRSVVPIVIGDSLTVFYDFLPESFCSNGWLFIPGGIMILASIWGIFRVTGYKSY